MAHTEPQLNPTTLKIFYLLRSGVRLSRNKHFELFRDPRARYARRLHRLFTSVCRDLEEHGQQATIYCALADSIETKAFGLHIEIPIVSGRRTVFLTPAELTLFSEHASNDIAEMMAAFSRYAREHLRTQPVLNVAS